jgi:hypothetical protein
MNSIGQPTFWHKFGGLIYSVTAPHTGSASGLLLSLSASTKWFYQVAQVEPGEWYEGRTWALVPSGEGRIFIRLSWYPTFDASGRAVSSADSPSTTSHDWTSLTTGAIQAPAGARSVRFRLMFRPRGPAAALFDDASLRVAPGPGVHPSPSSDLDDEESALEGAPTGTRITQVARDAGEAAPDESPR